jgi:hypothetical protein
MPNKTRIFHQQRFIALLKTLVPGQVNLARDLMDILEISQDGAYRRLRCETAITLDETVKICLHYSIPLEALNNEVPDVVTFQFNPLDQSLDQFRNYLATLSEQLKSFRKHAQPDFHYAAEDIPMFYHFGFPALTAFKLLYWMKSILNIPEFESTHYPFPVDEYFDPELLKGLYQHYAEIPGTEIWTDETIESTLQQIKFYWDAGFFVSKDAAIGVLDQMEELIRRIARQTETGQKIGYTGASTGAVLNVYLCDLMIGNNSIYVSTGESAISSIGYNTFNSILTRNEAFNKQHLLWMENLKRKSIQISGMAEKIRNQFFKAQLKKIDQLREAL